MPTVYIADSAIELPVRFVTGQVLSEVEAQLLNREYMKRLISRIRYRYDHSEFDDNSIHDGAFKMGLEFAFIEADANAEDVDENDPVFIEGMKIARELILQQLSENGLTEIPNLDSHARALYEGSEAVRVRARQRCETRWRLAREALETA